MPRNPPKGRAAAAAAAAPVPLADYGRRVFRNAYAHRPLLASRAALLPLLLLLLLLRRRLFGALGLVVSLREGRQRCR